MNLLTIPLNPRRGTIYLLTALAEAAWLTPILFTRISDRTDRWGAWFGALLLLVSLALLLGWLTDLYQIPLESARAVGMALAVLGFLGLSHAALFPDQSIFNPSWLGALIGGLFSQPGQLAALLWVLAAVAYIWWRALPLGYFPPGPSAVQVSLRLGFGMYAIILLLSHWQPKAQPPLWLLLTFTVSGLLAVSFAHTEAIATLHGEDSVGSLRLRWQNNGAMVGLVVVGAIVLASIFSLAVLDVVMGFFGAILAIILQPLAALVLWLLEALNPLMEAFFNWIQAQLAGGGVDVASPTAAPAPAATPLPMPDDMKNPGFLGVWLGWVLAGLAGLAILWSFFRLTGVLGQRYRATQTQNPATNRKTVSGTDEDETQESFLSAQLEKLQALWDMVSQFGLGADLQAAATIRRVYAALLTLSAQQGLTREPWQTPLEFQAVLSERWPSLAAEFDVLTLAYINTHYGKLPETKAELQHVKHAWETIYTRLADIDKPPPDAPSEKNLSQS